MSDGMDFDGAELGTLAARESSGGWLDGLLRRAVLSRLRALEHGELIFLEGTQRHVFGQALSSEEPQVAREAPSAREDGDGLGLSATVQVQDPRFYRRLALGGALGAADAYMDGLWTTDDLTAVVRVLARNRAALDRLETGMARLSGPLQRLIHRLRDNTRTGSRRNISAHYDLGNDFYQLFLDETMMYSCAVFEQGALEESAGEADPERAGEVLAHASRAKLDLICRKLELGPEDHVLEIGTGWGGFAVHAAEHYGCRVTTTTISRRQYEFAAERVRRAGLEDRVTILLEDYRDLQGRYDKLVSIEMIEAVGDRYLELFFRRCSELLKPEGMMLLQAITIADQAYHRYRRSVDFIQRYVFPGSCVPSVEAMSRCLARATDLRLFHLHDITPDYATTLRLWRRRFLDNLAKVRELGFGERFVRMWEYYLCYCEGGFQERVIGDVQMLLTKPLCRRDPVAVRV
ncbi:MAG: cyclopropane-fatty-acyl-phospholipid synthase family protein [Acidobacteriota bacterium]|nr:cyclopropane-fatty-acyl-phospholipid synthase family protein [Acidobacteriota bacterium]